MRSRRARDLIRPGLPMCRFGFFRTFACGMRYFLELQYNGAAYCGWQRQPNAPSVQQTLEEALAKLRREPVNVTGAGRTDTGVHASYYVAHFDATAPIDDLALALFKLNRILPDDISVRRIVPVAADAHARFDACEREYRYYIERRKNPFTRAFTWQYSVPLDVECMNRAAAFLLEWDEFTSFAKLNSNNKTDRCRILHAGWSASGDLSAGIGESEILGGEILNLGDGSAFLVSVGYPFSSLFREPGGHAG